MEDEEEGKRFITYQRLSRTGIFACFLDSGFLVSWSLGLLASARTENVAGEDDVNHKKNKWVPQVETQIW